jgi:elongation factor G
VLDRAIGVIKKELGEALEIGAPEVAYRETITESVEIDYTHKKQTGGSAQFARVMMRFEPADPDGGFSFESKLAGGSVPEEFVPAVRKGIETALRQGTLAAMPVVNIRATLLDGRYHEVDSSALSFEIAGRAAFREALQSGKPVLLEPIVEVDVTVPEGATSQVIGDLRSRRGELRQPKRSAGVTTISALVPLANMFGYFSSLRAMGGKEASHSMRFSHYAAVPRFPDDDTFPPAIGMRA